MTDPITWPSFDDHNPEFRRGFECGLVWTVLSGPVESPDEVYEWRVHFTCRGVVEEIAEKTGWSCKFTDDGVEDQLTVTCWRPTPRPRRLVMVPRAAK